MSWRLLNEDGLNIHRNLAVEESLARVNSERLHKTNTLRLWRASKAVVIGRFQCVHKELDINYCKQHDIVIARRFTGGGAVYHDEGNLNFSLCMSQEEPCVARTLPQLYRDFVGAIAGGLNSIGVPAEFDEHRSCLRIRAKKITGTAGWMKRGVSFIHGTLLINAKLETLRRCLSPPPVQTQYMRDKRRIRCMESKRDIVTSVCEAVPECPSDQEIADALVNGIRGFIGMEFTPGELTKKEEETADALYQSRYSQSEWNLGIPHPENE